jgi:hypothetical protein
MLVARFLDHSVLYHSANVNIGYVIRENKTLEGNFEPEGHIFLQNTGNRYQITVCYIWEGHNL